MHLFMRNEKLLGLSPIVLLRSLFEKWTLKLSFVSLLCRFPIFSFDIMEVILHYLIIELFSLIYDNERFSVTRLKRAYTLKCIRPSYTISLSSLVSRVIFIVFSLSCSKHYMVWRNFIGCCYLSVHNFSRTENLPDVVRKIRGTCVCTRVDAFSTYSCFKSHSYIYTIVEMFIGV